MEAAEAVMMTTCGISNHETIEHRAQMRRGLNEPEQTQLQKYSNIMALRRKGIYVEIIACSDS